MSELLEPPDNPLEIAKPFAEQVGSREIFGALPDEETLLVSLDEISTIAQTEGSYFVETGRALSIPASFDAAEPVELINFFDLTFEGPFTSFSIVHVGKIVGAFSVRALCLAFEEATLLPYFDSIPSDHLLHVPVLAVESIARTN